MVLALEPRAHRRLSGGALVRALGALGDFADLRMPERSGYARRVPHATDPDDWVAGLLAFHDDIAATRRQEAR